MAIIAQFGLPGRKSRAPVRVVPSHGKKCPGSSGALSDVIVTQNWRAWVFRQGRRNAAEGFFLASSAKFVGNIRVHDGPEPHQTPARSSVQRWSKVAGSVVFFMGRFS